MVVTAYPYYSLENSKMEPGVKCKGCLVRWERGLPHGKVDRDRTYSERTFLSHFSWCEEARKLWAESDGGRTPSRNRITRRGAYVNKLPVGSDGLPA
ncbi:hypothetical protein GGR56DRAFT_625624 [Xylariaceae sp. FL0804]|nr:hypothetical protein GGR56DRAFT_625624 [Xylariaceae sp. FL0804]